MRQDGGGYGAPAHWFDRPWRVFGVWVVGVTALLLDVAESAFRRFTRDTILVLLLVATMTTPACLVADDLPNRSHDGRYASCTEVTEDGVTEHLDAFAARCGTEEK